MANDEFDPSEEEEYQYTGDTYVEDAPARAGVLQKVVFVVLTLAIVGFAAYSYKDAYMAKKANQPVQVAVKPKAKAPVEVKKSEPKPVAEALLKPPTIPERTPQAQTIAASATAEEMDRLVQNYRGMQARMRDLTQQNTQVSRDMKNIQAGLKQLYSATKIIDGSIANLNQGVNAINTEIQKEKARRLAAEQAARVAAAAAKKKVQRPMQKAIARTPYTVRAIIPGRAWLINDMNKAIITVVTGDTVQGYGEVRNIDPDRGIVVMANGSVFHFGAYDG